MVKKALLIAGTGTMGVHVSELLMKEGFECWVTSRSKREDKNEIQYIQGNPHDNDFLRKVLFMNQWTTIVDFTYYTTEELSQKYKLLLSHTDLYVFLSTARVYANYHGKINEDSPRLLDVCRDKEYVASDEYAIAKAKEEDLFINSGKKNWIIVRPYITYGENTFQLSCIRKEFWLLRALKGKAIYFASELADKLTSFTYGYDVARGIVALISHKESWGDIYNIMSTEPIKWVDILDIYLDVLEQKTGARPKVYMVEKWTALMTGTADQVKYDRLYDRQFDCSRISRYMEINTFVHPKDGIKRCLESYLKTPYQERKINMTHEAQVDRITGDWEPIKSLIKHSFKNIFRYIYHRLK